MSDTVGSILQHKGNQVWSVSPDDSVLEAIGLMADKGVGALVVIADERMQTELPGLLVAGEAVGGANGANRLSGNAITEALAFGRRAGRTAAERVKSVRAVPSEACAGRESLNRARAGTVWWSTSAS